MIKILIQDYWKAFLDIKRGCRYEAESEARKMADFREKIWGDGEAEVFEINKFQSEAKWSWSEARKFRLVFQCEAERCSRAVGDEMGAQLGAY